MCNHTSFLILGKEACVEAVHAWHTLPLAMSHTSFPFLISNSLGIGLTCDRDKYIMSCFPSVAIRNSHTHPPLALFTSPATFPATFPAYPLHNTVIQLSFS